MKVGITGNYTWFGPPIVEIARRVEASGFDSLWMGEHPVIPVAAAQAERYGVPLPENYRHMPDPFTSLAAAAAVTSRIRLGTNVCIVPQHEPVTLAKQLATLDRISGGRLIFGFGTGWIEQEADVFGYRFDKRLGVTLDHIAALKALWTEDEPRYDGEYVSFPPLHCNPRPIQTPHIPLLVGSGNDKTDNSKILRRVARIADGWLPSFLSPGQARDQIGELRGYCEDAGRDFAAIDVSLIVPAISFGVGPLPPWGAGAYDDLEPVDAKELLGAYEEAGVTRILLGMPDFEDDSAFDVLAEAADKMGISK